MNAPPQHSAVRQALLIGAPLAAAALAASILAPAWTGYQASTRALQVQRGELAALQATPLPPADTVLPAADDVPSEPSQFLAEMNGTARAADCDVVGLDAAQPGADAANGASSSTGLRTVHSKVILRGNFQHVREFLARVRRANRLYVVTEVTERRAVTSNPRDARLGLLETTVAIDRYVARVGGIGTPTVATAQQ